ncbi:MAG: UDP-N-acetylmuramoyl-L-alanyl-D-glutamate--2,6-diaminopimelate ligase [Clostridiales bacterium]|nr:UDP-N-acetylmuramoyl-L-alanyl-D-glutamate--2,6-diaminopimelate ligase [Clostridiales bacterium]
MKLKKLLNGIKVLNAKMLKNVNIENISNNTQDDLSNALYVCLKGKNADGHALKQEAQKRGAIAFLVEELDYDFNGLQILVKDTRLAFSIVAKNFYSKNKLPKIIGITGTNGKTTTTNMVQHILNQSGKKAGLIGTEGIFYGNQKINLHMTTPDPLELFKHLNAMAEEGIEYAVMEVSAHAIYLKKIEALNFYVKAITNITEDHLDFFGDMQNYAKTKIDFIEKYKGIKVVNLDDQMVYKFLKNKKTFTYSKRLPADCMAVKLDGAGSEYDVLLNGNELYFKTNLIGYYNVENALCAALICNKIGVKNEDIVKGIASFKSVDGRLNIYKKGEKTAIIDFAHTPDALQKILNVAKTYAHGRVLCLFGCGGNRDSSKRALMGEIASNLSDYVYITNDNPRFENEKDIANQIASGIKNNNYEIICDREKAAFVASNCMCDGDILVLAGKGTEDYIEIMGEKLLYSDASVLTTLGFERV